MTRALIDTIKDLLAGEAGAADKARALLQEVTPAWDADAERLVCVHPKNGETYPVKLEDVNGSIVVHAELGDDSQLTLEMDDSYGDWSETVLVVYFQFPDDAPTGLQFTYLASEDFKYDWR